jgi:uncharacterized protein (DUF2126 family)
VGEFIAGVRYRAWQPPSALHPTIGIDSPLVFDLVDTWTGRAVSGCTYHVIHPGGRSYEKVPVNSYEAEGRRLARFFPFGHTPGGLDPLEPARETETRRFARFFPFGHAPGRLDPLETVAGSAEFRYTVDLRLAAKRKNGQR